MDSRYREAIRAKRARDEMAAAIREFAKTAKEYSRKVAASIRLQVCALQT